MHFSHFPILAVLLAIGVEALLPRSSLVARQLNFGVCNTACAPFVSIYEPCMTEGITQACICTTAAAVGLQACINCVTVATDLAASVISAADSAEETFSTFCAGIDVPSVTVPGGGVVTLTGATISTITQTAAGATSATAAATTTSKAGGSAAIPGASSRNMLPNIGIINVMGAMILGVMLVP